MKKVLYIPLDDRPANLDDIILQGKAAGIQVIVPPVGDIRNRLDSHMTTDGTLVTGTSGPTFGKPEHIRRFIFHHASKVDGFIISLDMLVYGGLIGSRRLRATAEGTYPAYDSQTAELLDVIREVKQAYPYKPVYVLDTIMRLASTVFVDGLAMPAYTETRTLMQKPRKPETELLAILNGYDIQPDGTNFPDTVYVDKEQYYNAKRHKLTTTYYMLDQLAREGYIDFVAIGVDDAYIDGIQANEIAFVEERINEWLGGTDGQNPERAIILPDADGLGHSLLARMAKKLYCVNGKPRFAIRYFGPDGRTIVNPYEYMDVHQNLLRHIDIVGGEAVDSGEGSESDMEIIAITAVDQAGNAVSREAENAANMRPTIVIDFTGGGAANAVVTTALLGSKYTGSLLGYSGWNTAGNKIGMALGMAHSRYACLTMETHAAVLDTAMDAHGSLLFKRFLKDYYYKVVTIAEVRTESRGRSPYTNVTADQNMRLFNSASDFELLTALLQGRMQTNTTTLAQQTAFGIGSASPACAIRQIRDGRWSLAPYTRVVLKQDNPKFIWDRAFEITLEPVVSLRRMQAYC
ncbi:hypothetical protein BBD42_01770 [Paenibacillus sp. BIHB 4019]|uniref:DUF4127 domain-containing protein n=1 Tax=Paenibacillus sp. BIHB 4019 TaxID=1870819 RepID=A0A1B2DCA7_9BACL|nr:DUF4127 family protein [Paenibacillus sp. BIHB 4019]ANY65343.1 hypothetical protein BBD42_01770 [Paenibacillus sp. BIHB 4019]